MISGDREAARRGRINLPSAHEQGASDVQRTVAPDVSRWGQQPRGTDTLQREIAHINELCVHCERAITGGGLEEERLIAIREWGVNLALLKQLRRHESLPQRDALRREGNITVRHEHPARRHRQAALRRQGDVSAELHRAGKSECTETAVVELIRGEVAHALHSHAAAAGNGQTD